MPFAFSRDASGGPSGLLGSLWGVLLEGLLAVSRAKLGGKRIETSVRVPPLGPLLGASWAVLGPLGPSWGHLGGLLVRFELTKAWKRDNPKVNEG